MSVSKFLMAGAVTAASLFAISTQAGGIDVSSDNMPVAPVVDNGYYFEGHVGYAYQNYHDSSTWVRNTSVGDNTDDNRKGGFSGGLAMGYKINNHVAVELGWFQFPSVNTNASGVGKAWMQSWALYLAGKYIIPLSSCMDGFFKVGVAYRNVDIPASATIASTITDRKSEYVRPMFAVGMAYNLSVNFAALLQYAYFMGANNSFQLTTSGAGALGTVAANVATVGLAYKFTV